MPSAFLFSCFIDLCFFTLTFFGIKCDFTDLSCAVVVAMQTLHNDHYKQQLAERKSETHQSGQQTSAKHSTLQQCTAVEEVSKSADLTRETKQDTAYAEELANCDQELIDNITSQILNAASKTVSGKDACENVHLRTTTVSVRAVSLLNVEF